MKLNKQNWKKVKLGDIAIRTEVTERNPLDNGLDRFIKVEHMDAESLEVKRWGNIGKDLFPPTFYKKFVKGQILFPTRNPHLRRAVIAPFDGICGEKTLTLSANEEMIHKDFFPFIFNSDSFINHCIHSIVGSTNPHVRWRNIAEYEFLLPSKKEQEDITALLKSINYLYSATKSLQQKSTSLMDSHLKNIFQKIGVYRTLNSLLKEKPRYGASKKAIPYDPKKPRYIRITDIDIDGKLFDNTKASMDGDDKDHYKLENNDILIARTANPGKVYLHKQDINGVCTFAGYLIRFRLDESQILPEYFFVYSKTQHYWIQIFKRMKKGTISNINTEQFGSIEVPVPSIAEQRTIIEIINEFQHVEYRIRNKMDIEKLLSKSIVENITT